jgi:hypothetical protein
MRRETSSSVVFHPARTAAEHHRFARAEPQLAGQSPVLRERFSGAEPASAVSGRDGPSDSEQHPVAWSEQLDQRAVQAVRAGCAAEDMMFEIRLESFNVLNTPQFCGPEQQFGSGNFGRITSQCNDPRQVQLGAKFYF